MSESSWDKEQANLKNKTHDIQGGEKKVMKKSLKVLASATLAFSMFASVAMAAETTPVAPTAVTTAAVKTAADFTDLASATPAQIVAINALLAKGYMEGETETTFNITGNMNRAQAAKLVAKIFGLTVGTETTSTFSDVDGTDASIAWSIPFIEAAKKAGILEGVTDATATVGAKFAPTANVTIGELAAMLVKGFGKKADVAVTTPWYDGYLAVVKAAGIDLGTDGAKAATRADLVVGSYAADVALQAALKTEGTVKQAAPDKITVTFNKAVDTTKATFELKKGTIGVNVKSVTWDEAKKVATLQSYSNLSAGDYTVNVAGLNLTTSELAVKVEASKAVKIETIGTNLVLTAAGAVTTTVGYKVTDQFGADITAQTSLVDVQASTSAVSAAADPATKKVTVTFAAAPKKDDVAVLTLIDSKTAVVSNVTLKVADPAQVATIELGALVNKDNKVLRAGTVLGTDLFQFPVTAKDQYGTAVTAQANLASDITVLTSNAAVINAVFVGSTSTTPAYLKLVPGTGALAAGSYVFTLVSKSTGTSTSVTVKVEANIAVETFAITAPVDAAIKGEKIVIPFTSADQYGNALTKYSELTGLTFSSSITGVTPVLVKNPVDGTATLEVTVPATETATTFVVTSVLTAKAKVSTVTLSLNAAAKPTTIVGIKDAATGLLVGATSAFTKANFVIKDQYNRDITINNYADRGTDYSGWTVKVEASDATFDKASASGASVTTAGTVTFAGLATGTEAVKVTLVDAAAATVANSSYEFTLSTLAKADIKEYVVETAEKAFAGGGATYRNEVKIYGKTEAGVKVALAAADIVNVNSTNAKYAVALDTGKYYGTPATALTTAGKDETATIVAAINGSAGVVTVTKNVTLTDAARVGGDATVEATAGTYVSKTDNLVVMTAAQVNAQNTKVPSANSGSKADVYFQIKDQYGIASNEVAPVYYTLTAKDAAGVAQGGAGYVGGTYSIDASTGAIAASGAVSGNVIEITSITSTGAVKVIKIVVQ